MAVVQPNSLSLSKFHHYLSAEPLWVAQYHSTQLNDEIASPLSRFLLSQLLPAGPFWANAPNWRTRKGMSTTEVAEAIGNSSSGTSEFSAERRGLGVLRPASRAGVTWESTRTPCRQQAWEEVTKGDRLAQKAEGPVRISLCWVW